MSVSVTFSGERTTVVAAFGCSGEVSDFHSDAGSAIGIGASPLTSRKPSDVRGGCRQDFFGECWTVGTAVLDDDNSAGSRVPWWYFLEGLDLIGKGVVVACR